VSAESEAIFLEEWNAYEKAVATNPAANTSPLVAAATGHSGASRPQLVVQGEYLAAQADEDVLAARTFADELCTIRMADEVAAGNLPFRAPTINTGG
jgi:hypothetical protein